MMSSMNSNSLQSLVAQLANFESNFINVLTQAALRLSDLSGRELFLLVKSQAGTYYAGSRELCAAYKIGTLGRTNDDEVHITKDDQCKDCARNQPTSSESHATPPPPPPPPPPTSLQPPSRKRISPFESQTNSSPSKRSNLAADFADENHVAVDIVKTENTDSNYAIALDEDDDDIIWEEDDISSTHHNGFYLNDLGGGVAGIEAANYDEARRYCPSAKELALAKIERLKGLRPDEVFVKRSREHQLLSTVMYGFGRDLALEFVEETKKQQQEQQNEKQKDKDKDKDKDKQKDKDKHKEKDKQPKLKKADYFNEKYAEFVKQFPELTTFKTKIKRSRNQIVSAAMYIKNIAQKAFYKRAKKEEDNIESSLQSANDASNANNANDAKSQQKEEDETTFVEEFVKVETGLIDPKTGFTDLDFYPDDEDDDDDIQWIQ